MLILKLVRVIECVHSEVGSCINTLLIVGLCGSINILKLVGLRLVCVLQLLKYQLVCSTVI